MGLRLPFGRGRKPARERPGQLHIGDPRFDGWEVVREIGEIESARAWWQHLDEAGIPAALTSDWELDRFGRGDIYLQVPPEHYGEAETFLSNLDLD